MLIFGQWESLQVDVGLTSRAVDGEARQDADPIGFVLLEGMEVGVGDDIERRDAVGRQHHNVARRR
jgi:hypothetical protein